MANPKDPKFEDGAPNPKGGCVECDCKAQIEELEEDIEELEAALVDRELAQAAYNPDGPLPEGYRHATDKELQNLRLSDGKNSLLRMDDSDFQAEVFVHQDGSGQDQYKVAFRGTQTGSDWGQNFSQGLGWESKSYARAAEIATRMEARAPGRVSYTGHSLGGGLASTAAGTSGAPARTFNAAGLHENTIESYGGDFGQTQGYYLNQDPLSTAAAEISMVPEAVGTRHGYERVHEWTEADLAPVRAQEAKEYSWLERKLGRPILDRNIAQAQAEANRQLRYHSTPELAEAMENDLADKKNQLEALEEGPCKDI